MLKRLHDPGQTQHLPLRLVRPTQAPTVGVYLSRWLTSRRALRETTIRSYEGHIRRYLTPHLGDVRLDYLDRSDIDRMYDTLLDPNISPVLSTATVVRIHATLLSALNAAVRTGLITQNPAALVELPQVARPVRTVWSPADLMRFLDVNVLDPHHGLYALLGICGLRRGEALGLRWCDVDLENRQIRIVQQLSSYRQVATFGPPKSRAGNRVVAIDEHVVDILQARSRSQRQSGKHHGWTPSDQSLVFTHESGAPLNPVGVTRHFDRLVRLSGLPVIRLHDLRHTSASIGLASGESLLEVSRRLGHSSIAITGDIYTHVSPEAAQAAAQRMHDYLQSRR